MLLCLFYPESDSVMIEMTVAVILKDTSICLVEINGSVHDLFVNPFVYLLGSV